MTLTQTLYEGGTQGATQTTTNTGASQVTLNGGTATFDSAMKANGTLGGKWVSAASTNTISRHLLVDGTGTAAPASTASFRRVLTMPTAIGASPITFWAIRHTGGAALSLRLNNSGKLDVIDAGATIYDLKLAGTFTIGGQYEYSFTGTSGSTTASSFTFKMYAVGGTSPLATITSTTANLSVNALAGEDVGIISTTGAAGIVVGSDNGQRNGGTTTELAPIVDANVAPSVTLTANQNVAAGATVTATATATDSDGSIASFAWSVVSASSTATPTLTGGTTATVTFTAPAVGNLVTLQCVVTDNVGATATATTEVRVPLTGSTTIRPLALAGSGAAWTNTGGAASDGAALADALDTTYLESPSVSATESARRVRLQPANARATLQTTQRLFTDTGTANTTVRLYEGTTLRQSWTQAVTTTATDYVFTASGTTVSAVGDWGFLFLEVGATS